MEKYHPQEIEGKWQKKWQEADLYRAEDFSQKPKFYCLDMFPYPSGEGLHVGHWRGYVLSDLLARFQMLSGKNVLHPIGWDAFGLPAENAAIKSGSQPKIFTQKAIEIFRRQLKQIGAMFDWSREINTSDPSYYQWTQWLFLKLYENGLAYRKKAPVNWCPSCQTVLANEQVIGGLCERCESQVIKKDLVQWFFKITDFAEELLKDLDKLDWPERTKTLQRNWIGKSEGAIVKFPICNLKFSIEVFTTRIDTLYGCTYVVLAPEHPILENPKFQIPNAKQVEDYISKTKNKSEIERAAIDKEKTGVFTGLYAINPINNQKIPIWVADYVLMGYGTGACMCVPAHDIRDFEFAKKFKIPIRPVIRKKENYVYSYLMGSKNIDNKELEKMDIEIIGENEDKNRKIKIPKNQLTNYEELITDKMTPGFWNEYIGDNIVFLFKHKDNSIERLILDSQTESHINKLAAEFCEEPLGDKSVWELLIDNSFYTDKVIHTDYGVLINSNDFNGLTSEKAKIKMTEKLKKEGTADFAVKYRLRDWLISRQRYWGAPIPIIYCDKCGEVPVPEKDLPVVLPENVEFKPKGESPLKQAKEFQNTKCPKCGGKALRETDTMDTFVDSAWYYLRYLDSNNTAVMSEAKKIDYWLPVDLYIGGVEHAILHLLYARFVSKALHQLKIVNFDPQGEPFRKLFNIGMVYLHGAKMSKSKGNIVSPDELIEKYGTDALRGYELFIGPADQDSAWQIAGISGIYRFLQKVWIFYQNEFSKDEKKDSQVEKTIKIVTYEIENLRPNTAISHLMELFNYLKNQKDISQEYAQKILILISPFFPHLAEELWKGQGHQESIFKEQWPEFDQRLTEQAMIKIAIQIDGKTRAILEVEKDLTKDEVEKRAKSLEKISFYLAKKNIQKVVFVPGKILNFVLA